MARAELCLLRFVQGCRQSGRLGLVILAAVATGVDPLHFGGRTKSDNLVARLEKTEKLSGSASGSFGSGAEPERFQSGPQSARLRSEKNIRKGTRLGAAFLAGLQCPDGGWEYSRVTAAPCVKPSPKNYSSPDTNTTAIAVDGSHQVGDTSPAARSVSSRAPRKPTARSPSTASLQASRVIPTPPPMSSRHCSCSTPSVIRSSCGALPRPNRLSLASSTVAKHLRANRVSSPPSGPRASWRRCRPSRPPWVSPCPWAAAAVGR